MMTDSNNRRLLFVYGTLLRRSSHPMARFLAECAVFLGEVKIAGRLYNLGRFPGLTAGEPGDWTYGDLYDLGERASTTLTELDRYEGDESTPEALFHRKLAEVICADETKIQAWVWWFRGAVRPEQRLLSGRYL